MFNAESEISMLKKIFSLKGTPVSTTTNEKSFTS